MLKTKNITVAKKGSKCKVCLEAFFLAHDLKLHQVFSFTSTISVSPEKPCMFLLSATTSEIRLMEQKSNLNSDSEF